MENGSRENELDFKKANQEWSLRRGEEEEEEDGCHSRQFSVDRTEYLRGGFGS